MTIAIDEQKLRRLQMDVADLHKKDADQAKKVAEFSRKLHSAGVDATRSSSISAAQRRVREIERYSGELTKAQHQRANIAAQIGRKIDEIGRVERSLADKRKKASQASSRQDKALRLKQDARIKELERLATNGPSSALKTPRKTGAPLPHDVFISHAYEDKDGFVRELANRCKQAGIDAWYDEHSLQWGESLRQAIDRGLSQAYFGIVVLSENFFKKKWTNYELDGLLQKESSGRGAVLPIWYKVTKDEVEQFSPSLANRLALNTATVTVDQIVEELATRVAELRAVA